MHNYQKAYSPEQETVEIPVFMPGDLSNYERSDETQALVDELDTCMANQDYKNANPLASKLIGIESDNVKFWLALCESTLWHFHPNLALKLLANVRFLFPMNAQVYLLKAKCYALMGKLDLAFKEMDYALERDEDIVEQFQNDPQLYFVLAMKSRKEQIS